MSIFITFEGGEGSGKTTHVDALQARLEEAGHPVLVVHEPGSTALGQDVREWLKRGVLSGEGTTELLLFTAARSELVAGVIRPFLDEHDDGIVIADRYSDSTIAYQSYGRGLPIRDVRVVNGLAVQGLASDLTFLLDCPPEVGLERVGSFQLRLPMEQAAAAGPRKRELEGTRFEQEPLEFHQRVRDGYLTLAKEEPDRWRVLDAMKSVGEIGDMAWRHVSEKLASLKAGVRARTR